MSNPLPKPNVNNQVHFTSNGTTSAKFAPKMTWKRALRIEKAARLEVVGGLSHEQIANQIGLTQSGLAQLKRTKAYQAKMLELATGVLSSYDEHIRQDIQNAHEELKTMVPMALMTLRSAVLSKNEKIRLDAAREILDREGTLSKVSRTSVSLNKIPDMTTEAELSKDLVALLQAPQTPTNQISSIGLNGFTVNASASKKQVEEMANVITPDSLEELESASPAIQ